MFKGNEKFIDPPLRLFDFFNTRKKKWLLPILYLIYKLIFIGDIDTWFTKVKSLSDYSSKLTNSLGWTGRYVCLLSCSDESL